MYRYTAVDLPDYLLDAYELSTGKSGIAVGQNPKRVGKFPGLFHAGTSIFYSRPGISRGDDEASRLDDHGARIPGEGALRRGGYRYWKARCGGVTIACPPPGERTSQCPPKMPAGRDRAGGF